MRQGSRLGTHRAALPATGCALFTYVVALILWGYNPRTTIVTTVLALILAVVFVLELLGGRREFSFPLPLVFFLAFICYSVLQMIWSPGSLTMLATIVQVLVMAVIVTNYVQATGGPGALEYAVYVAIIATFVVNLVGLSETVDGRTASTLGNPNLYSFLLMTGATLGFRRLLAGAAGAKLDPRLAGLLILFVGLCLYGIVYLAGSRKGILISMAAVFVLAMWWLGRQPVPRRAVLAMLLLLVLAALGYLVYRSPQFSRIVALQDLTGQGIVSDHSLQVRSSLLRDAFRLWFERPITGWGLDQFKVASGWGYYSHDNYVELLAGSGVIGLAAYLGIYLSALAALVRAMWRTTNSVISADLHWALTLLGMLLAWDVAAVSYYEKLNWIALSLVVGIGAGVSARLQRGSDHQGP